MMFVDSPVSEELSSVQLAVLPSGRPREGGLPLSTSSSMESTPSSSAEEMEVLLEPTGFALNGPSTLMPSRSAVSIQKDLTNGSS